MTNQQKTMKKIYYLSAIAAAIAAVSCVQEEAPVGVPQEGTGEAVVFSATFSEKPDSKATLTEGEEKSVVSWEANDEVVIFEGTESYTYVATPEIENAKNATLAPKAESVASAEGEHYALFLHPSGNAQGTLEGNVITTTLPAVQIAEPNTFATHLAVAKTTGTSFSFKNVCGLVRVEIKTSDVKSVVLEGLNGENVAGGIKVTVADAPTWAVDGENGSKTVTLKAAADDAAIAPGVYFFAVLPQTFENGFKVTTNKLSGDPVVRTTAAGVTVERCDIVKGNANGIAGKGTEADPYIIMTAQDMCDMRTLAPLGGETWFKLGADIDMEGVDEWIPVNFDGNFERKIHFDGAKVVNPKTKADCYTISNFGPDAFVNELGNSANYPSLFGVLYGSFKNVNIVNASITNVKSTGVVGGYIGTSGKPGECVNVHVQGKITQTGSTRTGGFAGVGRNATLTNCTVDIEIESGKPDVGGFFGYTTDDVKMTGCTAVVDIESSTTADDSWRSRVGGLVGYVAGNSAIIENCHTSGVISDAAPVSSSHTAAMGGLVGHFSSKVNSMTDCSSSVNIETEWGASVGGAIGINGAGALDLKNTSASGNVKGTANQGGLVGTIEYLVTKVSLENCSSTSKVTGAGHYCGGLVGWIQAVGDKNAETVCDIEFTNCHAEGNVTSTGSSIAGLVGGVANVNDENPVAAADFTDCSASGDVTGANNVGGLVGNLGAGGNFIDCSYEGDVIGSKSVGGLVGNYNSSGVVRNCYSIGTIKSTLASGDVQIGGLVGNGYPTAFESCSAECDIVCKGIYAGGIVGYQRGPVTVDKCSFEGTITSGTRHAGGIIGRSNGVTTIRNCSASTSLGVSDSWAGGIIAYAAYNVTVEDCYSNCTVTGGKSVGGIMGQCTVVATFDSCIAWGTVSASNAALGAIIGAAGAGSSISDCYYNPTFTPAAGATGLHGTAAPAGSTISSLAETLGWDETIWDLTGDVPVLN